VKRKNEWNTKEDTTNSMKTYCSMPKGTSQVEGKSSPWHEPLSSYAGLKASVSQSVGNSEAFQAELKALLGLVLQI